MKNQLTLFVVIMFLSLQFVSPLYISFFAKNIINENEPVMWYAISSGMMAAILIVVYAKNEKEYQKSTKINKK